MAKAGLGHRSGTAGVKMGVAVFAACLLVVVDGCFSLAADAAQRWMQLANKKNAICSRVKMSIKSNASLCTSVGKWGFGKRRKNNKRTEKYRRDRKKKAVMLG